MHCSGRDSHRRSTVDGLRDVVIGNLPSSLADNVDAVRQVGNFAAHPIKSTSIGEIVEVEENEAEWLLDVLEELFDFDGASRAATGVATTPSAAWRAAAICSPATAAYA